MIVNLPAFHQQSTTNSPSINHSLHPVFAKTPSKNAVIHPGKKILKIAPSFWCVPDCSLRRGESEGIVIFFEFKAEGLNDQIVVLALRQP